MKNRIGMGNSISDFKALDRNLDEEDLEEFSDEIDEED